jgi:hypothetical protein
MTSTSRDSAAPTNRPLALNSTEIDKLLSMTLIANLATLDDNGSIHILPMWFLRIRNDICIPTPEVLSDASVASYLSQGDHVTVRIHMDHLVSWNLADSKAGKTLSISGGFHQLDA